MSCVLHVLGEDLDIDSLLETVDLTPRHVFRKGDLQMPLTQPHGPVVKASGAAFAVSDTGLDGFCCQVKDAVRFLTKFRTTLERITKWPGITTVVLDFGVRFPRDPGQWYEFPPELVRLAGRLDIALVVSIYAAIRETGGSAPVGNRQRGKGLEKTERGKKQGGQKRTTRAPGRRAR